MNYIKQFNQWMDLVSLDDRITPHHISIYVALFQFWNKSRFQKKITICRYEVLQLSKVGSTKTYYKCLHQLHEYGYIQYFPSHNPLKGSTIIMNDLCDFDLYAMTDPEETPDNSSIKSKERPVENIPRSAPVTEVQDQQNSHIISSKNATSGNPVVTPLLINNINLINYKQRERRAHARDELKNIFFKNQENKNGQDSKSMANGLYTEGAQKSRKASSSSPGGQLESKKNVPHENLIPTLDQVKYYFMNQLSGNYVDGILDHKDREIEAEKFFNHYESNGWLLGGKAPMRNWKAACRSWIVKVPYFTRKDSYKRNSRLHAPKVANYAKPL